MKFGDRVRVIKNKDTIAAGLDGQTGQIYGETTPSLTLVTVIGRLNRDYALNVQLAESNKTIWFAEECLEIIDHGQGTNIKLGDSNFTLDQDGQWIKQD